jgi:hypothetical protein
MPINLGYIGSGNICDSHGRGCLNPLTEKADRWIPHLVATPCKILHLLAIKLGGEKLGTILLTKDV